MGEVYKIRLAQDIETIPTVLSIGRFSLLYAYGRAGESRSAGELGQDYLTFQSDGKRLAFVLCDGVSQSFYGDLAARLLGDCLVDWLWDLPSLHDTQRYFLKDIVNNLTAWTTHATVEASMVEVPGDTAPLVRDVLENKRLIGSEAMFACGLISLSEENSEDAALQLAWLGDIGLKLFRIDVDAPVFEAKRDSEQRWSTRQGIKGGEPQVYLGSIMQGDSLIVFSDGLLPIEDRLSFLDEIALVVAMDDLLEQPMSDDMSLLEIRLIPTKTVYTDSKSKEAPPARSAFAGLKKKIMDRVPPKRKVGRKTE